MVYTKRMLFKKFIDLLSKQRRYYFNLRKNLKQYKYLKSLFKQGERKQLINKTIIFNTVKGLKDFIDREFFIGKLLALNGAEVIMLLDDGILKHWETGLKSNYFYYYKNYRNLPFLLAFRYLMRKAKKTYKDENLKIIYYSSFLKQVNQKNWHDLKKYALSSTIRNFKTSELNLKNKEVKSFYNLSLKNALLSRNVGEYVLTKIKPDYFITSHGIYSTWGSPYEFLKKNGIKSLVQTRSHSHSLNAQDIYFTSAKAQTLSRCKFWQSYKNTQVSKEMEAKVKKWLDLRMSHNTKDTRVYYENDVEYYRVSKGNGYKYNIGIFPSVIWDGNIEDRHLAFRGILDWLISTIDFLKNKKDVRIYLKFHPAEVTMFKESEKIQDLIRNYLDSNKIENLILIPADHKIDPYEFIKSGIDLGICYDGVLALEMPLLGIPVILGGVRGRFSVDGGNYTINNKQEYFNYLSNIEKNIENFQKNYNDYYKNIIRYTYWYIFENPLKLPSILKTNKNIIDLTQVKKEDLVIKEKLLNVFE